MVARERGFTLIEVAVAVGILTLLLAGGAWAFSFHPNALGAAADDFDAALAQARAIASSSGNGATLVFAPRPRFGFSLRVYGGRPTEPGAVSAVDAERVAAEASIQEQTLGEPPFAIFIDSAGDASGEASYPAFDASGNATFAAIAQEPPCPSGGFVITLSNVQRTASMTRQLPCRSTGGTPPTAGPSPTPNVPIVTPTALLFHWPADAAQQFVTTEWGYTHWFAAQDFTCGNSVAAFPNILPSPYTAAYAPEEAALPPSPPPNAPYSYPNSGGGSTNDAPAAFPLQPQGAGLCTATVQDEFGQSAGPAVAVMGWLTATYGSAAATHASGTIAIPPSALPATGSSATISLAKTYDANAIAPRALFTGSNATTCAADVAVSAASGTTPSTPSPTAASGSMTFTVVALPPAALSCGGIIYNHYSDTNAPSDDVAEAGEGIGFTLSLSPPTGLLTTLGKIVFWLGPGNGGLCSYAQLYLQNGNTDANAPNIADTFNHTDANGCVTNNAVNLWATESNYNGQFSVSLEDCATYITSTPAFWSPTTAATVSALVPTENCSFQVQSSDQSVSSGGAKSVTAAVNACSGSAMSVGVGSGCQITIPVSWGGPLDCTPDGAGGSEGTVSVTESPDPMLGTLTLITSNGESGNYLWTRTAPGTQTISYLEVVVVCGPGGHGTHASSASGSFTFN